MYEIEIPGGELYDELKNEFYYLSPKTIKLEHSLVSLSKWERKWHVPFLTDKPKSIEQTVDYIKCMTISQNVDPNYYSLITDAMLRDIMAYVEDPMTATTVPEESGNRSREPITAELIYYWMIELGIPVEFQKWHLNSLLTLIKTVNFKRSPEKKRSQMETAQMYKRLNAERRKALNTKG